MDYLLLHKCCRARLWQNVKLSTASMLVSELKSMSQTADNTADAQSQFHIHWHF